MWWFVALLFLLSALDIVVKLTSAPDPSPSPEKPGSTT